MTKHLTQDDPYQLHRVALSPLLPGATQDDIACACEQLVTIGEETFSAFLQKQGLAPMWDYMLQQQNSADQLTEDFKESLHQSRLYATATYLIQRHKLTLIKEVLENANIPHAVYKGADTRERLYEEPALRPAVDIDILVLDEHKVAAIKAFKKEGYEFYASAKNISHEANLNQGKTSIDLHWDILRPGRTRIPMAPRFLDTRVDYGSHWAMSDEATLFVMLVHPVFVKYGTTPQAALMRMVDIAKLLAKSNVNWKAVIQLLDEAGLKTAAWITLSWLELLTGKQQHKHIMSALKPSVPKQKYLQYWLHKNLSSRLLNKPVYVQLGFTLPAHDRWGDAFRAIRQARKLAQSQDKNLTVLLALTEE
jgi:hypothetical protein